jgi:probable rRNA maturation factor
MGRGRDSDTGSEITVAGRKLPIATADVQRIAAGVLEAEGRSATLSVTFLGAERMRQLNLEYKAHDRPTDVLAFPLSDPGGRLLGDIYICTWVARREAGARGIPLPVEIARLVIHGTLHVLGYDHPEGEGRTTSAMWHRQEDYVRSLT